MDNIGIFNQKLENHRENQPRDMFKWGWHRAPNIEIRYFDYRNSHICANTYYLTQIPLSSPWMFWNSTQFAAELQSINKELAEGKFRDSDKPQQN